MADQVIKLNVGGESFTTLKGTPSSSSFFQILLKKHEDGQELEHVNGMKFSLIVMVTCSRIFWLIYEDMKHYLMMSVLQKN